MFNMSKPNTQELVLAGLSGNVLVYKNPGNYTSHVADWPLSDAKNLVHKHTPGHEFHVVYDKTAHHVDVFMCAKSKSVTSPHFYTEHLMAIRRDAYHQTEFFVELVWIQRDDDTEPRWHLVINRKFSQIDIYELPTCKLVREFKLKTVHTEFLGSVYPLDVPGRPNRYFMVFSWIWGPIENTFPMDIHDLVKTGTIGKISINGGITCINNLLYDCIVRPAGVIKNLEFVGFNTSDYPIFVFHKENIKEGEDYSDTDTDADSVS